MNDYLAHYGILGMKWGVRRYQNEDGTLTEAGKKREARRSKREEIGNRLVRSSGTRASSVLKEARGKDINKLTNKELQDYNQRLNLEQQFANYTKGSVGNAKDWITKTVVTGVVVGTISGVTKSIGQEWLKDKLKNGGGHLLKDFASGIKGAINTRWVL